MSPGKIAKLNSDRIIEIATAFHLSKILFVGVEFDVFSIIGNAKLTPAEVAGKCYLPLRSATRLLNGLTAINLLKYKNGKYFNTPVSLAYLVKGKPDYLGGLMVAYDKMLYGRWGELAEATKNDSYGRVFGPKGDTIGNISVNPEIAKAAIAAQHAYSVKPAEELAGSFNFSKYKHLLDLGGGSGIISVMAAKKHPKLKATIFDFPPVCKVAEGTIANYKMNGRVKTHPGNILKDPFPQGADLILISGILDGYNEENCRKMINKAYDYLPKGGAIILKESIVSDDRTGPLFPVLFSIALMIETEGGDSRSRGEMTGWLKDAGFKNISFKTMTKLSGKFRNLGYVTGVK